MPSGLAKRKGDLASKLASRPTKKAKIVPKVKSSIPREATPPPKPKPAAKATKAREATPLPDRKGKGKAKDTTSNAKQTLDTLPSSFKVIAGSYEKLLYGLEGTVSFEDADLKLDIKPIFIFPAHVSYLKAVAASPGGGKWLATGSADEIVKVWDLRRRKEIGGLMHHEGSITHLQFPSRSHLLSASEDGTLCLFRARDWAVLRSLKGHKGRVNCVGVHPSGKLALSVGKDRTLRMWDLMRGKGSASTKIGKEGELVRWSTDGSRFCVQTQSTIDIYSVEMELLHTITHPSRLHDLKFCQRVDGSGEVLLAAAEDKKLSIYDIPADHNAPPLIVAEMIGHTNRVKAVDTLKISLPSNPNSRSSTTIVTTISSDGKIRLFDLASLPPASSTSPNQEKVQIEPITEYDTKGSRLTCLTLADGEVADPKNVNGKRKREVKDEDEDGSEESNDEEEQEEWDEGEDDSEVEGEGEEEDEEEDEEEYESA